MGSSSPCGEDIGRKHERSEGGATPHSPVSRTSSASDSAKMTESSVNGSGRRPQSPDSVKMAASSASEADSAMSQVGFVQYCNISYVLIFWALLVIVTLLMVLMMKILIMLLVMMLIILFFFIMMI